MYYNGNTLSITYDPLYSNIIVTSNVSSSMTSTWNISQYPAEPGQKYWPLQYKRLVKCSKCFKFVTRKDISLNYVTSYSPQQPSTTNSNFISAQVITVCVCKECNV